MPWCEECSKYLTPGSVNADGTCPKCGRDVDVPARQAAEVVADEKAPWHFKLLVAATVVYLVWRFVQIFT